MKQSLRIFSGTRGKLQNLKSEGNAVMKIASTRLVGKLIDDPIWFQGGDFEEGHSALRV